MKQTEKELREAIKNLELIIDNLPFDVWLKDLEGRYVLVNKSLQESINKPLSEIIGKKDPEIYPEENARMYMASDRATIEGRVPRSSEARLINGAYSEEFKTPLFGVDGNVVGTVGFSKDVTDRKQREEEIIYLSFHDQLTGLYNRRFFEEEMKRLNSKRNLPITLVMIDVNGLKLVNDAFGHHEGDELLRNVAKVLKTESRANDIVSRVGGDEFTMLLLNTTHKEAEILMNRINEAIEKETTDKVIYSISTGWATKYKAEDDLEKIYMLAEDRMYLHKLSESPKMRRKTIEIVLKTLYEKSERVRTHSQKVAALALELGRHLGMTEDELVELEMAALMHDIGKIGMEKELLNKERPYTKAEEINVLRHPEMGYQILRAVDKYAPIAEYVLYHHERPDGKGYPRGLGEEDIPFQSKIISLVDFFEGMINRKAGRAAISQEEAVAEIKKNMGTQFDEKIANIFIEKVIRKS